MTYVDSYINNLEEPYKSVLQHLREVIKKTAPDAEETKSYGMPAFKHKGVYLIAFFVFKDHLSLFPTAEPIEKLQKELQGFTLAKGTIQFTPDHTVPDQIVEALVRLRVQAIDGGR